MKAKKKKESGGHMQSARMMEGQTETYQDGW